MTPRVTGRLFEARVSVLQRGEPRRTAAIVVGHVRFNRGAHAQQRRAGAPDSRLTVLVQANQDQQGSDAQAERNGANPPHFDHAPQPAAPLPGEQDAAVVCALEDHGYSTSSFICNSGIKIAMAMKPTAAPIATIMIGSSKLVKATTRVSTSAS
jgi:hypothetical protein